MRRHELGALLGVELHDLPLLVGQLAVGDEDRVGEDELADVVEQAGGVDQVLLALREPKQPRHLARVAGDGGGVPCGHRVAHRQRLEDRADEPDLERRQLTRPVLELLAALVGLDAGAQEVLADEQHDGEQPDRAHADALVDERDAGGKQRHGDLNREDGEVERAEAVQSGPPRGPLEAGDHREVQEVGDHEHDEHRRRGTSIVPSLPGIGLSCRAG